MTESAATPSVPEFAGTGTPIVARAGRYYRNARYAMTIGLLLMGAYFAYDGYKGWPAHNAKVDEVQAALNHTPKDSAAWFELDKAQRALGAKHSDLDITVQKVLGYALPVVAIAYLIYFLRKSRGEIRLDGDTLGVPGHAPIPLSAITNVDDSLWKKKGIATLRYDNGGTKGVITLDDFVYEQASTDVIYDRIVARSKPAEPTI